MNKAKKKEIKAYKRVQNKITIFSKIPPKCQRKIPPPKNTRLFLRLRFIPPSPSSRLAPPLSPPHSVPFRVPLVQSVHAWRLHPNSSPHLHIWQWYFSMAKPSFIIGVSDILTFLFIKKRNGIIQEEIRDVERLIR